MNERTKAALANLNMKTDALKPFVLSIFLAACAQNSAVSPTVNSDQSANNENTHQFTPIPILPSITPRATWEVQIATMIPTDTAMPSDTPEPIETLFPPTIIFDLEGGGTIEMKNFSTVEDALNFISGDTTWFEGNVDYSNNLIAQRWIVGEAREFVAKIYQIKDGKVVPSDMRFPRDSEKFFHAMTASVGSKTVLVYIDKEEIPHAVHVEQDISEFESSAEKYKNEFLLTPTH